MTTNPNTEKSYKITLAHDSFTQYGGAERLFSGVAELYQEAKIFTLAYETNVLQLARLVPSRIYVSWLQPIYNITKSFQWLFALIPTVLFTSKIPKSDIVLSSSSSFIKGLKKGPALHVNYCHTPPRFLWIDPEHAYKEIPAWLHWLAKPVFKLMKQWDLYVSKQVDFYIANSKEVQNRIKKFYHRDSEVIYPFIDTSFWKPIAEKENHFLVAGRLQYAKGLDAVIKVFNQLQLPLHVIGTGRYESELKKLAGPTVKFFGKVTDEELRYQYSIAKAFVYPQFEDFGLMPIEAAACGTPTIGLAKGGSLETIIPNKTGVLLPEITERALAEELNNWDNGRYSKQFLVEHAQQFSKQIFQAKLLDFVNNKFYERFR